MSLMAMGRGRAWLQCLFSVVVASAAEAAVIYVNHSATGAGNGTSWSDAFTNIQPALDAASAGDQVWVAAGHYVGLLILKRDVGLYGGFSGTEDPINFDLAARDYRICETILDGDQAGSVVTGPVGATETCRLDGFTVTNGNAPSRGGGIYLDGSSPTLANNIIRGNSARRGGGLYAQYSISVISDTLIEANVASRQGGGLCALAAHPLVARAVVRGNSAPLGGGLFLDSAATMIDCNILENSAGAGGGVYLALGSPAFVDRTTFNGNFAFYGGAVWSSNSASLIANSRFSGNAATQQGSAVYLEYGALPTIANVVIAHNTGALGVAAVHCSNARPTITNAIIAFNHAGIVAADNSPLILHSNCVYGNVAFDYSGLADPTGTNGNISAEPMFCDGAGLDGDPGTWMDNDYRLSPGSPCIDAGDNMQAPRDVIDFDGDGDTSELLANDLAGWQRFVDDPLTFDTGVGPPPVVDIGAYEYHTLVGDLNCDDRVDFADINRFVLRLSDPASYAAMYPGCPGPNADINGDDDVSFADINPFVQLLARRT